MDLGYTITRNCFLTIHISLYKSFAHGSLHKLTKLHHTSALKTKFIPSRMRALELI